MRTRSFRSLLVAALLLPLSSGIALAVQTGDRDLDRVIALAKNDSKVMDYADFLCNDIGPRLTGSRNYQRAAIATRDLFREMGLEARLEQWGEVPVGFDRGPWSGRMVAPEEMELTCGTNSWTPGTLGPVTGPLVPAPKPGDDLEAIKERLAGAWILEERSQRGRGGNGGDAEFRQQLSALYDEVGIAGIVRPSSNDWILTSGRMGIEWNNLPTRVEITVIKSHMDTIQQHLDAGTEVMLEFDIENHFFPGPVPQYNVIADLVGTDFPDEYVYVGGHLDSWDGATGATDNATGCSTALEAARLLTTAGVKPRRTIRFALWGGEEQGLLGSRAYVQQNPELMEKISAVLIHDMGTNYLAGISYTKVMAEDMQKVFAPVVGLDKRFPFELREVAGLSGGGSDHASFLGANVPGFFWSQKGDAVYNVTHHTQLDHTDRIIERYQRHSSLVLALGALGTANLDHMLSREGLRQQRQGGTARGGGGQGGRRMGIQLGADGLTIDGVSPDTLAQKAGWKTGDRIIKIDGESVKDRNELLEKIRGGKAQKAIHIQRGEKELVFDFDWEKNTAKEKKGVGAGAGQ